MFSVKGFLAEMGLASSIHGLDILQQPAFAVLHLFSG